MAGNENGRLTNRAMIERIDERTKWQSDTLKKIDAWITLHTREHVTLNDKVSRLWAKVGLIVALLAAIFGAAASVVARALGF